MQKPGHLWGFSVWKTPSLFGDHFLSAEQFMALLVLCHRVEVWVLLIKLPRGGRKIYLALPPYGLHILLGDMGRFQAQQHLASEELAQHFSTPDFTFSSHLLSPPNPRETCGCVLSNIGHSLTPCGSNFPGQAWHFGHRRKMTNLCASTPSGAILSLQVPWFPDIHTLSLSLCFFFF